MPLALPRASIPIAPALIPSPFPCCTHGLKPCLLVCPIPLIP